jgi:hypothetical protein
VYELVSPQHHTITSNCVEISKIVEKSPEVLKSVLYIIPHYLPMGLVGAVIYDISCPMLILI